MHFVSYVISRRLPRALVTYEYRPYAAGVGDNPFIEVVSDALGRGSINDIGRGSS